MCSSYSLHFKFTLLILGMTHLFSYLFSLIFESTVRSLSEGLALTRCIHIINPLRWSHRNGANTFTEGSWALPHSHTASTALSGWAPVCCPASASSWPQGSPGGTNTPTSQQQGHFSHLTRSLLLFYIQHVLNSSCGQRPLLPGTLLLGGSQGSLGSTAFGCGPCLCERTPLQDCLLSPRHILDNTKLVAVSPSASLDTNQAAGWPQRWPQDRANSRAPE